MLRQARINREGELAWNEAAGGSGSLSESKKPSGRKGPFHIGAVSLRAIFERVGVSSEGGERFAREV